MAKNKGPIVIIFGAPRPYYTVLVKWEHSDPWSPEFGSYDKGDIEAELPSFADDAFAVQVITTDGNQASIDNAVAHINSFITN